MKMEPGDEELLVRRVVKEIMCSVMGDDDGDVDEDDAVGGITDTGANSNGSDKHDSIDSQDT